MQVNYAAPVWQPKGPLPPKIDRGVNRLFLYQERVANRDRIFKRNEGEFSPMRPNKVD